MEDTKGNTFDLQNLEIVANLNKNGVVETVSTTFLNDKLDGMWNFMTPE